MTESNETAASEVAKAHGGIIVVEDGAQIAGRMVWWRLQGTLEHDVLVDAWEAEGLDEKLLPSPPGEHRALRRVLGRLRAASGGRLLVRPLGRGAEGFALINEEADGRTLDHSTVLTTVITKATDDAGIYQLDTEPGPQVEVLGVARASWIAGGPQVELQKLFAAACTEHDSGSTSSWLTWLMPRLQAVCLRDKGGIYFLPRDQLVTWDAVLHVLREVSDHAMFQIPALRTQDAVDAILDAVTQEAAALAQRIEQELNGSDDIGVKALRTRIRYCDEALDKVGRYEALLGAKLDDICARIDDLKVNVSQAILMAEAAEDAAHNGVQS